MHKCVYTGIMCRLSPTHAATRRCTAMGFGRSVWPRDTRPYSSPHKEHREARPSPSSLNGVLTCKLVGWLLTWFVVEHNLPLVPDKGNGHNRGVCTRRDQVRVLFVSSSFAWAPFVSFLHHFFVQYVPLPCWPTSCADALNILFKNTCFKMCTPYHVPLSIVQRLNYTDARSIPCPPIYRATVKLHRCRARVRLLLLTGCMYYYHMLVLCATLQGKGDDGWFNAGQDQGHVTCTW